MSSTAVTGIGELVTCDGTGPERLGLRSNAALVIKDNVIVWIGSAADAPLPTIGSMSAGGSSFRALSIPTAT